MTDTETKAVEKLIGTLQALQSDADMRSRDLVVAGVAVPETHRVASAAYASAYAFCILHLKLLLQTPSPQAASLRKRLLDMIPAFSSNGYQIRPFEGIVVVKQSSETEYLITVQEPVTLTGNYDSTDYRLIMGGATATVTDGSNAATATGSVEECLRKIVEWSY